MCARPIVGINADYRTTDQGGGAFSVVSAGYYDAIAATGAMPIILPPLAEESDAAHMLDMVDAVVLVGGADLDPHNDGFMRHPAVRPLDPRREAFDRMLAAMIVERRKPAFGIGVGMQLLNLMCGGNLHFHIPEDLPRALPHKDTLDAAHRHGLEVTPGSLMDRVFGDGEIRVNSFHHMAIDELADEFRVTARCPDGVIEAIESTRDDWFALGTQFHPEAGTASALDQRIFEEFVTGATGHVPVMKLVA